MHSQSIATGRVLEGEGTLTLRANAHAAEDPEQFRWSSHKDGRQQSSQAGTESNGVARDGDDTKPVEQSIIGYEDPIQLTQSTHSFLFTEKTCSTPFFFAILIVGISYLCLMLALYDNLIDDYSPDNIVSAPVNVSIPVKITQYLALLIGLVMEEEIPETLYLIRMISKTTLHRKAPNIKFGKFIFCAALRIIMGYLFYLNMFVVVVQATGVIEIFFDVLALQFLQQLDDIAFRLSKMDVFGKHMKRASTRKCFRAEFEKLPFARRKKMTIFVKAVYIINFCALMAGITSITIKQMRGEYQCKSITVNFGNDIWEGAIVVNSTGGVANKDLIYSYFNGVYMLNGTYDARPVYTEQNKFDNGPYKEKTGATIRYCRTEKAWVFMHDSIRKDLVTDDNNCPWLLRSPVTDSFNLLEVSGEWTIWTGTIVDGATFQATCNKCDSEVDCNYHGECTDGVCSCLREDIGDRSFRVYAGIHCQFPRPCVRLRGDEGDIWDLQLLDSDNVWKAYDRAVYFYRDGGNITSRGPDDELLLMYSGSRWFAAVYKNSTGFQKEYWIQYSMELHAFWDEVYKEITHAVSNPTSHISPIGVDFFRIGKRGERYGPLGELHPAQDPPGSGYFECALNKSSIPDFVLGSLPP